MLRSLAIHAARLTPTPIKRWLHGQRALDNLTRKLFAIAARSGGEVAEIEHGPMKGLRLPVGEHISHAHLSGDYELDTQQALAALLEPGMVCYDLGASIGYLSLLMARKARAVYAFEPAPHAAATICALAAANGLSNIEIVPFAVSDEQATVRFAVTDVAYGSSIVERETEWPTIEVRTTTLDAFIAEHEPPDLIKIDIEGAEGKALRGARKLLAERKPLICCEVHSPDAAREVLDVLTPLGYEVRDLEGREFRVDGPIVAGLVQVVARPIA